MKDEKILQDELMTDEELDNVAGGYSSQGWLTDALEDFGEDIIRAFR